MKFRYYDMEPPFPIRYPDDFEKFVEDAMPNLFIYDRYKKQAYCSSCGSHIPYINGGQKPKEIFRIMYNMQNFHCKDTVICPVCGKYATAIPHKNKDAGAQKTIVFFWTENEGKTVKFAIVVCCWSGYKGIVEAMDPKIMVFPEEVGIFTRNEQRAYLCYGHRYWTECGSVYIHPQLINQNTVLHMGSYDELKHSFLKHATNITTGLNERIKELALNAKYPQAEYIAKAGLEDIIRSKLYGFAVYINPNWQADSIPAFLRLTPQDVDKLRQWDMWNVNAIAIYQKVKVFHNRPTKKMIKDILEISPDISWWTGELRKQDPLRLARYLNRLFNDNTPVCGHGLFGYTFQFVIREYKDYLKQAEDLGYNMKDEYYLYPKDFNAAHERVQLEYRQKLKKEEQEKMAGYNKKLAGQVRELERLCYENDKYIIRPLRTYEEFISEGRDNHNCVASYFRRAAEGSTKIFVIREKNEPDKSFVTLELSESEKEIKQCRSYGNGIPPQDVMDFAIEWLTNKVAESKKRGAA